MFKAWDLKSMEQHIISTGTWIESSSVIQTSSSNTIVPAELGDTCSLIHNPPAVLSRQLCLPHPSCGHSPTHHTLHELEEMSKEHLVNFIQSINQDHLAKLAELAKKRFLGKLIEVLSTKAFLDSCCPIQQHTVSGTAFYVSHRVAWVGRILKII